MTPPWTGETFKKHVHGLTAHQYRVGAAAATNFLEQHGDEGAAVRVGIAAAKRAAANATMARIARKRGER